MRDEYDFSNARYRNPYSWDIPMPGTDWFRLSIGIANCPRRRLRKRMVPRLTIIATPGPFGKDLNLYIARWLVFRMDWYKL